MPLLTHIEVRKYIENMRTAYSPLSTIEGVSCIFGSRISVIGASSSDSDELSSRSAHAQSGRVRPEVDDSDDDAIIGYM